jgi:hypothetical protein
MWSLATTLKQLAEREQVDAFFDKCMNMVDFLRRGTAYHQETPEHKLFRQIYGYMYYIKHGYRAF